MFRLFIFHSHHFMQKINFAFNTLENETIKILKDDFIIYRSNKLIFEGDIFALENKFQDAKKSFKEALMISENETKKNIINLKISALTE